VAGGRGGGHFTSLRPSPHPGPPSRSDRIAAALRADGATAARLLPAILDWGPRLSDGQAYDVALAIARESRQRALRPELVAALIRVESAYVPTAVSPTNDHGLMQLHGDPVYDIARNVALGCSRKTIDNALTRARRKLRALGLHTLAQR